jgi:hypothetical protein
LAIFLSAKTTDVDFVCGAIDRKVDEANIESSGLNTNGNLWMNCY